MSTRERTNICSKCKEYYSLISEAIMHRDCDPKNIEVELDYIHTICQGLSASQRIALVHRLTYGYPPSEIG